MVALTVSLDECEIVISDIVRAQYVQNVRVIDSLFTNSFLFS